MEIEIEYRGVKLMVEGTYVPEEPMVMYYPDGSGYPGSSEDYEIEVVLVGDVDIYDIFTNLQLDDIRDLVLEKMYDEREMYEE